MTPFFKALVSLEQKLLVTFTILDILKTIILNRGHPFTFNVAIMDWGIAKKINMHHRFLFYDLQNGVSLDVEVHL